MSALPIVLMTEEEVAAIGREQDAGNSGFGCLKTDRGLLPLAAMDVDARVAGVVAAIDVAQTFVNTTGTAIEATYIFPLPDRAAVHRFRMEVAGRVIEGVVDERGAAREQYEEAIAKGHRAAITEEERAGVFTLRVGNLMPGEAATVRLSLVGPLPVDDGEVTLRFPLVVAPRYMPGAGLGGDQAGLGTADDTDLVPDASRISPPVLLPGVKNPVRLGIRVALEDASITGLSSSLHAVTSRNDDARVIEIQPGEKLDRDFILRWRVGGRELASSLVCVDDADGKAGTWMLTFVPPSTTSLAQKPRDVVFVLDRSGSMEGWKMVAARRACARMIDTLTSRDRFAVIAFDDYIESIPGAGLSDATDRTRFRAVEAIAKVDARGGTELAQPLAQAASLLTGFGEALFPAQDAIDRLDARPACGVLLYPVIAMEPPYTHALSCARLLGDHPDAALVARRSPARHVTAQTPPVLVAHAFDDPAVPWQNSTLFIEAMQAAGRPVEAHFFEEGGHGFGIGPANAPAGQWPRLASSWLDRAFSG